MSAMRAPSRASAQGRYPPTLLDRLMANPDDGEGVSRTALQAILRRDIGYVLGTTALSRTTTRPGDRAVTASTLHFGIPALVVMNGRAPGWGIIEQAIRQAVLDFEPRLTPSSVRVVPIDGVSERKRYGVLHVQLEGVAVVGLHALEVTMRLGIDLETGAVSPLI